MSRADMTHDLLESVYGDLPEMPAHTPILRPDSLGHASPGCHGPCNQGRTNCPCPEACGVAVRDLPASCSDVGSLGEKVMLAVCCIAVLVIVGPSLWHGLASLFATAGGLQ